MVVVGAGALVSSAAAFALITPGVLTGVAAACGLEFKIAINYGKTFKDIAVLRDIREDAIKIRNELIETVDTKVIARSPHGIDAFTKFPDLKEKFMLALAVDKVLAEEKPLPDLDKAIKASASVQL